MSYAELYTFCQTLTPPIHRNTIRDKVLSITGVEKVPVCMTELDTAVLRGFYISATNTDHQFVKQHGGNVIVLARGLNRCWQRFVYVKELMHLFDLSEAKTNTAERFERGLTELAAPSAALSPATLAEHRGVWMALGALCPEELRLKFKAERERMEIDDYSIALQLLIPEHHVPRLFEKRYDNILKSLTEPTSTES